MAITHLTGIMGTVSFGTVTTASEFSLKIDRSVAAHARSGSYSDYQVPGKVSVSGTLKRIMITDAILDYAFVGGTGAATAFNAVGTLTAVTPDTGTVVVTANNCFLTSATFKFTDADEIVSDDCTFVMKDPVADLTIA
jgi:hypothetical protein